MEKKHLLASLSCQRHLAQPGRFCQQPAISANRVPGGIATHPTRTPCWCFSGGSGPERQTPPGTYTVTEPAPAERMPEAAEASRRTPTLQRATWLALPLNEARCMPKSRLRSLGTPEHVEGPGRSRSLDGINALTDAQWCWLLCPGRAWHSPSAFCHAGPSCGSAQV